MRTCFTRHAWSRVIGRLTLSPADLADILDWSLVVDIGVEESTNRVHRLFYSVPDGMCFVAVQDRRNGAVVTVLPVDFQETCAWRVSDDAQHHARELVCPTERVPGSTAPSTNRDQHFIVSAYTRHQSGGVRMVKLARVPCAPYGGCVERLVEDGQFVRTIDAGIAAQVIHDDRVESIYVRVGNNGTPVRVPRPVTEVGGRPDGGVRTAPLRATIEA